MADPVKSPNVHQRLLAAGQEVGYIKKDVESGSGKAKGVARDAVVAKCQPALRKHGVFASTTQVGPGQTIETNSKSSSGTTMIRYIGIWQTQFFNVDDPKDAYAVQHEAHGNDYGDKAPGKAGTYAEKLNYIRALGLETGIADEGRFPGEGDDADNGPAEQSIGEEKLKNFEASINAAVDEKGVKAAGAMAIKFVEENGNADSDKTRLRECGSKRLGALRDKKAAAEAQ